MSTRFVRDALDIMRRQLGRKNENDPDSSDDIMLRYLSDFVALKMPSDVHLFEEFGTLTFTIDETTEDGVYTFNEVGSSQEFINIGQEAFISLRDPIGSSISWNDLPIWQDPGDFFSIWGINNEDILIRGYPTGMLFYGNQMTFRTLPNTSYLIKIYGYKKGSDFPDANEPLEYDYWLRYIASGASVDYARDFRYSAQTLASIKEIFQSEKKTLLTRTHNQIKVQRCQPRF